MPANPIPQTVSQEARGAAISFAVDRGWWSPPFVEMIRSGGLDCNGVVQAFAAFEAQIRADCAARFVEKVERLKRSFPEAEFEPEDGIRNSTLDEAITAIQEPRP